MRTQTTVLLVIVVAISVSGCGRSGGGAGELPAAASERSSDQPGTRIADAATTEGKTEPTKTGVVEDGTYEVCDVHEAGDEKMGGSDKSTGPHVLLRLHDEIVVNKGLPDDAVGSVVFRHFAKEESDKEKRKKLPPPKETALTVIKCCEGQRLGATMGFEHQKGKEQPKDALHAIVIENAPSSNSCPKPAIIVSFCYPTYDDDGTRGWSCPGHEYPRTAANPHGGDVHASLIR